MEANRAVAGMLKKETTDTLDKVLFELSGQMKNAYARSVHNMQIKVNRKGGGID